MVLIHRSIICVYFAILVIAVVGRVALADTPGHSYCQNAPPEYWDQKWDEGIDEVKVYFVWESFLDNPYVDETDHDSFVSAVQYVLNQWNTYSGAKPWYTYGGETENLPPESATLEIKLDSSIPPSSTLASASPTIGPFCDVTHKGGFKAYDISFRNTDANGNHLKWTVGNIDDKAQHNFVQILLHEMGHTFGLAHTCQCPDCRYPEDCEIPGTRMNTFLGWQTMRQTPRPELTHHYVHGPYSWDGYHTRMLRGQDEHHIYQKVSFDGGKNFSTLRGPVPNATTNAPVGVVSSSDGTYTLIWQGTNGSNNVNTMSGDGVNWWPSTKKTHSIRSQWGISADGDMGIPGRQHILAAFLYSGTIGSPGSSMSRWVSLLYSDDSGASWNLQGTSLRSVARPAVAYSESTDRWLLAYESRDDRGILVHIMRDEFPFDYNGYEILHNGGEIVGAIGGVQADCKGNTCRIVFSSDGSGDVGPENAFRPRAAVGYIDPESESFVVRHYEWIADVGALYPSVTQSYSEDEPFVVGWVQPETGHSSAQASQYRLLEGWRPSRYVTSSAKSAAITIEEHDILSEISIFYLR